MNESAQKDSWKYRGVRQWTIELPLNPSTVNETTRRATRPIDPPVEIKSSFPWEGITIICVVGAGMYLLLYLGWLDFLIK